MARRWFSRKGLTLESEQVDVLVHDTSQFRLNGLRVLTTNDTSTGPQGPPGTNGANGIPTSLAVIGSTPNANGMTLSGSTLNLEPANGSFGGVVTNGTQTFGGNKVMSGNLTTNGITYCNTFTQRPGGTNLTIGDPTTTQVTFGYVPNYVTTSTEGILGIDGSNNLININFGFSGGKQGFASCSPGTITTFSSYDQSGSPLSGSANINVYVIDRMTTVEIAQFSWTAATGSPTTLFFNASQPLPGTSKPWHNQQYPILISNGGTVVTALLLITNGGVISLQLTNGAPFTLPVIMSNYFTTSFTNIA
jgi:hypothetical protein